MIKNKLLRMDNVLLVVDNLRATIDFFTELGLELEGETTVEGPWVDRIVGLNGVRSDIAIMRTPDGHGRLELDKFHTPKAVRYEPENAPVNTLGIRRIMFAVTDIDDVVSHLKKQGAVLIGEVTQFGDMYRLCYLRGPEGIIVALAEQLGNKTVADIFDFRVDKKAKTVFINREFAAPLSLVWDAFTKQEILDQWTAPAPWVSKTKYMNFEVGGKRFYAMVSPEGIERWSIQEYTYITPKTNFKMSNAFADKDENPELPGSEWEYNFSEENGKTKVSITIFNESFDRMEKLLEGFQQGFTMSLNSLEKLLASR